MTPEPLLYSDQLNLFPADKGSNLFNQLFEQAVDATLIWQGDRLVGCNQAATRLFGYTEADLLQCSHHQLSHSSQYHTSDRSAHPLLASSPQPGCHRFNWCYKAADHRPFLAEVTVSVIADGDRQMLFYEVCRPVGDRLYDTQPYSDKPAPAAQRLLQKILDTIPMAIFWKDRESVYLGCNQNFAEAAGLNNPDEIIGLTDYDLPWTTKEADLYRKNDQLVMTSKTAQYHLLEPQQRTDGSHIWCDTNKVPLYDKAGIVVGIMGTFEDVTQRKNYEDELEQKALGLEHFIQDLQQKQTQLIQTEKMSSLGQLVAGVAHEINNPVNFIHGNLSYARTYIDDLLSIVQSYQAYCPNPSDELKDLIEEIELDFLLDDLPRLLNSMQMGTHRIREIISSLRTFSRLDEAEVKAIDVHSGIDSTILILQSRLKASSNRPVIQLHKNYHPLPDVECYAGELNQVFMNILSNAIDALDERDKQRSSDTNNAYPSQIWISTCAVSDRNAVQISVRDNGPGIPEEIQRSIFDPFFTTKPVGQGTGLGMSISYQIIVERHQGRLTCRSTPGEGTEFIIEIPVKAVSPET
ncbi:MAG: ATP-binding protein [Cyanobacteria bacterium J06627_8]